MAVLPNNEHVFDFKDVGDVTGKTYEGQFTCLCILDMGQKHLLGIEKTRLQADFSNPTPDLAGIALIIANLRVRLKDGPEFWKQSKGGFAIKDENVLVALYDKVMEAEYLWQEKLEKKSKQAKEAGKKENKEKDQSQEA